MGLDSWVDGSGSGLQGREHLALVWRSGSERDAIVYGPACDARTAKAWSADGDGTQGRWCRRYVPDVSLTTCCITFFLSSFGLPPTLGLAESRL